MTNREKILHILDNVVYPETGQSIAEGGFVSDISTGDGRIEVTLKFRRAREPFAASLKRQTVEVLSEAFPETEIAVAVEEPAATKPSPSPVPTRRLPGVGKTIAIASGKGGVGKSTVAAHLAVALASEGYRVGVLDADIYGPSQPQLFGVSNYLPLSEKEGGNEWIVPAESMGVKIMSIGFFISPDDALVWRGPMTTGALKQLIRQTKWGSLDYLLIDLPPGTGDVHLSLVQELDLDGAVIISTPQSLAIADVKRGVEMFRSEGIGVPVLGIVENMAWFTPAEFPDNKYYIFGRGGVQRFAESEGLDFLGNIPIMLSVMESGENGLPSYASHIGIIEHYINIARKIVDKLGK